MKNLKLLLIFAGLLFLSACSSDKDLDDNSVKSITINFSNITNGTPEQLSVNVLPTSATNKEVTWAVSDATVAVISESGLLTPISNGNVVVTATAKDGSG